jgi:hypothetical protein
MIPNPNDERLILAIKEVAENNIRNLGVNYTEWEYRFGLAINDAKQGKPRNIALYSEYEYRYGLAVVDVSLLVNPRFNLYSEVEYSFAQIINNLIPSQFTIGTAKTTSTAQPTGTQIGLVSIPIFTALTVGNASSVSSINLISTANTLSVSNTLNHNSNVNQSINTASTNSTAPTLEIQLLHPDTIAYQNNITANGGSISTQDLSAIDNFVKGVYLNGLRNSLIDFSPLAGNNLNAALTKLWFPSGVQATLTNFNFIESDYSRSSGLTGNGLSKHLDTGFIPSTLITDSVSVALYNRSTENSQATEVATLSANGRLVLHTRWEDGNAYFDCFDSGAGRIGVPNSTPLGLFLGNRLSATNASLFVNNVLIGSTNTMGSMTPNTSILYYTFPVPGAFQFYSSRSIGMFSIGYGIELSKATIFNTLIQQLMAAFNRQV